MPKAKRESGPRLRQVVAHEWMFEVPRMSYHDEERFDAAIELLGVDPAKAADALRALVKRNPGQIDLHHHLALALQAQERHDEAMEEWTRAVGLGFRAMPTSFWFGRERLEWGCLANRPFLRAYNGLAGALMDEGLLGEAAVILNNILDLNPNDNQGVRMILVQCCFGLRRPDDVLRVCERYPDADPDLMYGEALALFQLGRTDEAEAAYRKAAQAWPRVHDELLKSRHAQPKSSHPGFITIGGADQAFAYWEDFGHFWKDTRGALAMARRLSPGTEAGGRRLKLEQN